MGYSHTMHLTAKAIPGVTTQEITDAFAPIMQYLGYGDPFNNKTGDDEFVFDPQTGELSVSTYGDVGYGYEGLVREVAANLGKIVADPGEIWLYDHDTGDIDNAKTVIEFGPTRDAIESYRARRDIEAGLAMMKPHLGEETVRVIRQFIQSRASSKDDGGDSPYAPVTVDRWFGEEVVGMANFLRYWGEREGADDFPKVALRGDFDEQYALFEGDGEVRA